MIDLNKLNIILTVLVIGNSILEKLHSNANIFAQELIKIN